MKTGFIGCGNMGSAIIAGMIAGGTDPGDITAADTNEKALNALKEKTGINTAGDNRDVVNASDAVVLCVKPDVLEDVLRDIKETAGNDKIIISIAAGKELGTITGILGDDAKAVRVMPNTPALVGEGICGFTVSGNITDEDKEAVTVILTSFGQAVEVKESLMDAVTAVGGSAPAYVYMFIEALADGAVVCGMPRDKAYKFAAQCVYGSAKLVMESGKHPGELKDMVCSPGGTTIEGVRVLEDAGFRSSVMEAVIAAAQRSEELRSGK